MQKARLFLPLAAASLLGIGVLAGCSTQSVDITPLQTVQETIFPQGVLLYGVDVSGKTEQQAIALLKQQKPAPEPITLTLTLGDETFTYDETDLVQNHSVEDDVKSVSAFLFGGSQIDYMENSLYLRLSPTEFGTGQTVTHASVVHLVKTLAEQLDKPAAEPKVASMSNGKITFTPGEDGIQIDQEKLVKEIESALKKNKTASLTIPTTVLKPEHDDGEFANLVPLGTFSTVSTNNANGNKNMQLAMDYCNRTVLYPGDTFSFNTLLGDSTNGSRGFVLAGAIVNGKLEDSYGGGICQASTTIYGAVIRTPGLTVTERYNHMWPSSYVPIGQDAAVDYGTQDFCFRNDTDRPIIVESVMNGTTLSATIYGRPDTSFDTVEVVSEETGTIEQPKDIYEEDKSLKKGKIELVRQGRAGKTASATAIFYKDGKVVNTVPLYNSYYSPIASIYHYGKGTKIPQN